MTRRLFVFFLVLAACFVLPRLPWLVAWDQAATTTVASLRSDGCTRFFRILSGIGNTYGFLVFLFLPVLFFFLRRRFQTALIYLVGVGLLKLSVSLVKVAVARPRPPDGLEILSTWAMPSGHAANAVFMFAVLGVFFWQRIPPPIFRISLLLFCFAMILLIGFSRIYLGVHYPTDVLLGWLYAASGLWVLQSFKRDLFNFA